MKARSNKHPKPMATTGGNGPPLYNASWFLMGSTYAPSSNGAPKLETVPIQSGSPRGNRPALHMKPSAPHSTGPCISTANSQARGNLNYKFTPTVAPNSEPKAKEKVKAKENQVEPKVTAKVAKGNETETARRVKSRRPPPLAKAGCADQTTQTKKKKETISDATHFCF